MMHLASTASHDDSISSLEQEYTGRVNQVSPNGNNARDRAEETSVNLLDSDDDEE